MQRRDLLKMIAAATGVSFIGSNALAWDPTSSTLLKNTGFSDQDIHFLNEVGEVIIPKTDTPGAKEAEVGRIIPIMVKDCFTESEQKIFLLGMGYIKDEAISRFKRPFLLLSDEQKTELMNALNDDSKPSMWDIFGKSEQSKGFVMIKQQVLFAFFTSKVGATKALRFIGIPGKYDGEYPYKKGDKAWAT